MGICKKLFKEAKIPQEFLCSICDDVLENPIMLNDCEHTHTFCKTCIDLHHAICEDEANDENEKRCPTDGLPVTGSSKPPRIFSNLLNNLELRCPSYSNGCASMLRVENLFEHVKICQFGPENPKLCTAGGTGGSDSVLIPALNSDHNCMACLKSKNDDLRQQLDATEAELDKTKKEDSDLRQQLDATRAELDKTKNENSDLRQQLDSTRVELDTTKNEDENLRQQLEATRVELDTTKNEDENLRQQLEATQAELDKTKNENSDMRQQLDATGAELDKTKEELQAEAAKLAKLKLNIVETPLPIGNRTDTIMSKILNPSPQCMLRPRVFFNMTADGQPLGRITMELRADVVPKTAENFRALCTGEKGFGYKGSVFRSVIPDFCCEGGEIINGTGGKLIYEENEKVEKDDEQMTRTGPGILLKAIAPTAGCNTLGSGSKFIITCGKTCWYDSLYVVFGSVVDGMDVVKKMEEFGSKNGKTLKKIVIADCGHL